MIQNSRFVYFRNFERFQLSVSLAFPKEAVHILLIFWTSPKVFHSMGKCTLKKKRKMHLKTNKQTKTRKKKKDEA